MKYLISLVSAVMLACAAAGAWATEQGPDVLVQKLSDEVLDIIRKDEALRNGDTTRAIRAIEEVVLPHFNLRRMTMLAVGRDWRQTTPAQQERLTNAFYAMLVRTYSNALSQYQDQTIDFRPLRMRPGETTARVQTSIRQSGAQPISVDYVLEKRDGAWHIFDIVVAGVSLVTNYRGTFAQEIRAGGIEGLINALETKNMTPADGASRS